MDKEKGIQRLATVERQVRARVERVRRGLEMPAYNCPVGIDLNAVVRPLGQELRQPVQQVARPYSIDLS